MFNCDFSLLNIYWDIPDVHYEFSIAAVKDWEKEQVCCLFGVSWYSSTLRLGILWLPPMEFYF